MNIFIVASLLLLAFLSYARYSSAVLLVAALLPTYVIRFSVFGIPTTFLEVSIWMLFIVGALQADVRQAWKHAVRVFPRTFAVLVALFLVAAGISTWLSPHTLTSLGILKSWIIAPIVFGLVVYCTAVQTREKGKKKNEKGNIPFSSFYFRFSQSLIASGTVVALLGISQFGTLDRIKSVYDVPNSLALFLAPLVVLATWPLVQKREKRKWKKEKILRAEAASIMFIALLGTQSVMGVMSVIATLVVGIALCTPLIRGAWGVNSPGVDSKTRKSSEASKTNMSSSRTYRPEQADSGNKPMVNVRFLYFLISIFLISFVFLWFSGKIPYLLQPLTSGIPNSISVRLQLWSISWELIKEHPMLGVGLGTFEPAYQQTLHERFLKEDREMKNEKGTLEETVMKSLPLEKGEPEGVKGPFSFFYFPLSEFVFRDPHNWILSFWLNTGLLGLISFIGIHLWIFWRFFVASRSGNGSLNFPRLQAGPRPRRWSISNFFFQSITLALLVLLIHGLADTIYWKNDLAVLQWTLLALAVAHIQHGRTLS